MRKSKTLLLFVLLYWSCACPRAWAANEDFHVVLVGVEHYAQGRNLDGPSRDVCSLYQLYSKILHFSPARIQVHLDGSFPANSPCFGVPVRATTVSSLKNTMLGLSREPGLVLFHFSGHGEERGGKQILLLGSNYPEGKSNDEIIYLQELHDTLFPTNSVKKGVVYFLDACRDGDSNLMGRPPAQVLPAKQLIEVKNKDIYGAVFSATQSGNKSLVRTHRKNREIVNPIGYFTWVIIKGLVGGAGDGTREIPLAAFAQYLNDEVPALISYELTTQKIVQRPDVFFFSENSKTLRLPALQRARYPTFLIFIETQSAPLNAAGQRIAPVSSHDVVAAKQGFENTEFLGLNLENVKFPGPFIVDLMNGSLGEPVAAWDYKIRLTYLFGSDRHEFILCATSPVVPGNSNADPEISSRVSNGSLVIDATRSLNLWGHSMADAMESYDPDAKPVYSRHVNRGCI